MFINCFFILAGSVQHKIHRTAMLVHMQLSVKLKTIVF